MSKTTVNLLRKTTKKSKDERFFETMVFMVTKNQKPSVVGMVTKKKFDGFGCWYGYKKNFWWFRLLVWLQKKFLMVSVVGMVTKQIFDGFGCWYGYKKKF